MPDFENKTDEATTTECWMHPADTTGGGPLLSQSQTVSLNALVAYAAQLSGRTEFTIERLVADRFNVPSLKRIMADQYDGAVRHIVDAYVSADNS